MVKYRLCQAMIIAAALAFAAPALGAPAQAGDSTSIASALAPPPELFARTTLSKRGAHFTALGADGHWQDAVVNKYASESDRYANQEYRSEGGTRYTVVNDTPERLFIWIETTRIDTYKVKDPEAPWTHKIKIEPGESVQISNLPSHTGAVRAYAGCNDHGLECAGHEGAATKWEWTIDANNHPGALGINVSLVDGYVIGGEFSFGEGSDCSTMRCIIPEDELLRQCPSGNLDSRVPGWPSCKSDCSATGSAEFCCTGAFEAHGACKPSSTYFSQLCPGTYAWPHDDIHYQECYPHGDVVLMLQK